MTNVVFSFSDLKYFFECPYQFKLRILFGFNAPIDEALGYGKSLHDALAEVHARAIRGDIANAEEASDLVKRICTRHMPIRPFASNSRRQPKRLCAITSTPTMRSSTRSSSRRRQIEISLDGGVSVNGRIDLVRRIDTGETTIVDLKSTDRAQPEQVTETQLHIYALGYQELTGRRPDYVEIYELDEGKRKPRSVDDDFLNDVRIDVRRAAEALRSNNLPTAPVERKCARCDYGGMCTAGSRIVKTVKGTA